MLFEQTEIAKKLGMSNTKFRLMVEDKIKWTLINNKRHYDMDDINRVIEEALRQS